MKFAFELRSRRISFRKKAVIIVTGMVIVIASLLFTNHMAGKLRQKEQFEVSLWTIALENAWLTDPNDPYFQRIVSTGNNIPFLMVDGNLNVRMSNLIPHRVLSHPDLLRKEIDKLAKINRAITISHISGETFYVFYGESTLLRMLTYFPFFQLLVIVIFCVFGYITFMSSKQNEQNRVWIGLAKETAHQLGTPTSSLLGWLEYLRSQDIDQSAVEEMGKDLTRLMKVVDRFSKIGSETIMSPVNVNEVVGSSVIYFRSRIPKNVTLDYNGLAQAPVQASVNTALFEWVVENLLKNSLDALQGTGKIDVKISSDENWVYIDVTDTGKGIPKSNFKRVFEPGFTTKTRGWGLGLSLSKRIMESYHKGRIFVLDSEPGKGSTFRVMLRKLYL